MPAKIKLDEDFIEKVRPGIVHVWSQIAHDALEACAHSGEKMSNKAAIETCIDANYLTTYGHKETDDFLDEVFKSRSYEVVLTFLSRNIRLDTVL